MGELSITFPPASTKAPNTFLIGANSFSESPTLKVIHEPNPIAGINSPDEGILRVIIAALRRSLKTFGNMRLSEPAVVCIKNESLDMLFLSSLIMVKITNLIGHGCWSGRRDWSFVIVLEKDN